MGRLPRWAVGKKKACHICGEEYGERELYKQRGNLVCKHCVDSLLDKDREKLKR